MCIWFVEDWFLLLDYTTASEYVIAHLALTMFATEYISELELLTAVRGGRESCFCSNSSRSGCALITSSSMGGPQLTVQTMAFINLTKTAFIIDFHFRKFNEVNDSLTIINKDKKYYR